MHPWPLDAPRSQRYFFPVQCGRITKTSQYSLMYSACSRAFSPPIEPPRAVLLLNPCSWRGLKAHEVKHSPGTEAKTGSQAGSLLLGTAPDALRVWLKEPWGPHSGGPGGHECSHDNTNALRLLATVHRARGFMVGDDTITVRQWNVRWGALVCSKLFQALWFLR